MFVMSNVLQGTATVLDTVLWLYMWVIIARALISWVNPDPWNPIVQFLERATEPVLTPIRRLVGWRMGMDLSPMIAILILVFLQYAVVQSLRDIAVRMQFLFPSSAFQQQVREFRKHRKQELSLLL